MSLSEAVPANTNEMPAAPAPGTAPVAEPVVAPVATAEALAPAAVPEVKLPEPPEVEASKEADDDLPYEPSGNEYIDSVLSQLHEGGVDFTQAFGKFSETGEEADINVEYMESILGRAATHGLIAGVKAENLKMEGDAAKLAESIHTASGSKEMWDGVCEWIASGTSGLSKEGWSQYNDMLMAGGVQSELAAKELSKMYQHSPGFTQPAAMVEGDATAQATGIEPISRRNYAAELDKVIRTNGENSPEAQLLHKRREAGMRNGQ